VRPTGFARTFLERFSAHLHHDTQSPILHAQKNLDHFQSLPLLKKMGGDISMNLGLCLSRAIFIYLPIISPPRCSLGSACLFPSNEGNSCTLFSFSLLFFVDIWIQEHP